MKIIDATDGKTCDTCVAQEGRHYCLLHSVQVKNMDIVRCTDWAEDMTEKMREQDRREEEWHAQTHHNP